MTRTRTRTRITKADAEKTVNALIRSLGRSRKAVLDAYGSLPELRRDWEWGWTTSHTYDWAIVWEEGPYEWAYLFPHGGIEEEFGFRIPDVSDRVPGTVFVEAITSWAVSLSPNDWSY